MLQYSTVQYSTEQYSTVQYITVKHGTHSIVECRTGMLTSLLAQREGAVPFHNTVQCTP